MSSELSSVSEGSSAEILPRRSSPSNVRIRGDWVFVRGTDKTACHRWLTGDSVELRGRMAELLWRSPESLGFLGFDFAGAGGAFEAPGEDALTLRRLLAPQGFGRLFLELTGRCNESCVHCYASSGPRVSDALSLDEIVSVLRDAKLLGVESVQFTGGDPLVSKHIREAVTQASLFGFERVEVYTNGLALDDELTRLFATHDVAIALSLYSHDARVHDAVTQTPGSHERTLRAIRRAVESHLEIRVSVILTDGNGEDTSRVRTLVEGLGVPADRVACDRERPVGRGSWREHIPIPEEELVLSHALPTQRTRAGLAKLCVTYRGEVVPCIFDRAVRFGSIRECSLVEILSRPLRFRGEFAFEAPNVGEPLACSDCRHRHSVLSMFEWAPTASGLASLRRRGTEEDGSR